MKFNINASYTYFYFLALCVPHTSFMAYGANMFYFCYYYKEIIYFSIAKLTHLHIEFTLQPWLKLKKTNFLLPIFVYIII